MHKFVLKPEGKGPKRPTTINDFFKDAVCETEGMRYLE